MMKLGSQTGSVMNHVMSRQVIGEPQPAIGMGATRLLWTDRRAGTISMIEYKKDGSIARIGITNDRTVCIAGTEQDGSADYAYHTRPDGYVHWFAKNRAGFWVRTHLNEATRRWMLVKSGEGLRIGSRDEYRDPSF